MFATCSSVEQETFFIEVNSTNSVIELSSEPHSGSEFNSDDLHYSSSLNNLTLLLKLITNNSFYSSLSLTETFLEYANQRAPPQKNNFRKS
jgi:hypothetical protein